jgi:alginate O-acetyltransferase complex protein AlgI
MLFTQARFFGFLLLVCAVHWALRPARARKWWLLVSSYVFYGCFDWRFLGLLWASTLAEYGFGRAMEGRERAARRPLMIASVVLNLGLLGTFKYFDFFAASAAELLTWLGFAPSHATLSLALPVGISFYTFQTMSYAIDVYRGRIQAERDLLDFALYIGFFPQIGAGPITRAVQIQPQLKAPRRFAEHVDVRAALTLFFLGFVKKACLADGILAYVDPVFGAPAEASRGESWSALLLYHVQIYCDFSGYTDMAIASAWLLGYRLPENFAFPYFSRGIGEFWRRWHISLSAWMRDYLYLPLVGKRPSPLRRRAALIVTMGLCGLWHGAGWQFISFGVLHGIYLAIEELWSPPARANSSASRARAVLACLGLNFLVILTWPVFRMKTFGDAAALYGNLFSLAPSAEPLVGQGTLVLLAVCGLVHWAAYRSPPLGQAQRLSTWGFAVAYGFAWALALPWVAVNLAPFIYFQF